MALEATIEQLKKKGKPNNNDNKGKGNGKKGKNKRGKKGDRNNEDKPKLLAWMTQEPPEKDKNKSKTYNKKEWWWCPNHKKYCHHRPEKCNGVNVPENGDNNANDRNSQRSQQGRQEPRLSVQQVIEAIHQDSNSK